MQKQTKSALIEADAAIEFDNSDQNVQAQSASSQERFLCYLATKSGKLSQYYVEVDENCIRIISTSKGKVKSEHPLNGMHAKEVVKQRREVSASDLETGEDTPT